MSTPNTLVWVDIPVTNLKRAIKYYSAILGVKITKESIPGLEFGLLPHQNQNVSGCLDLNKNNKPSKKGPLIYLNVDGRHDAAEKAAGKNGGKVLKKRHELGPYGFRTIIVDSEGNRLALHSSKS
jgi:predicted enzyme related to lactoylglutathione lyase